MLRMRATTHPHERHHMAISAVALPCRAASKALYLKLIVSNSDMSVSPSHAWRKDYLH
jgi:hypothetical protein